MADANVTYKFAGDEKDAVRALAKLEKKHDQLEAKIRQLGQTSKRAAKEGDAVGRGIAKAFTSAVGYGAALGVATKALQIMSAEWERIVALQAKSRGTQVSSADAFRKTLIFFQADKTVSQAQLRPELLKIAAETGADETALSQAGASAFSAKGKLTNRDVLNALRVAARVDPSDAEAITTFSARLLDLQKITPGLTPEAGAGLLTQVGGAARVTALPKLGKTFVPSAMALRKSGDTLEQSGELFSAATQLTGDEEGAETATALISLASQLQKFKPFQKRKDLTSTTARLAALQKDPKLAAQFLKGASFEKKTEAGIFSLVRGDKDALDQLKASRAAIKPELDPSQKKDFKTFVDGLNRGFGQAVANADRKQKAATKLRFLNDPEGSLVDVAAQAEEDVITAPGINLPGLDIAARGIRRKRIQVGRKAVESGKIGAEDFAERSIKELKLLLDRTQSDENKKLIRDQLATLKALLAEFQALRRERSEFVPLRIKRNP